MNISKWTSTTKCKHIIDNYVYTQFFLEKKEISKNSLKKTLDSKRKMSDFKDKCLILKIFRFSRYNYSIFLKKLTYKRSFYT